MSVYYAVAIGRNPGIYPTWHECKAQVNGFSGSKYKKFKNIKFALDFIESNSQSTQKYTSSKTYKHPSEKIPYNYVQSPPTQLICNSDRTIIYTDGACPNNGNNPTSAGIGVFFGDNDPRNISLKLTGHVTNNIAEMTAVIYALDAAHKNNLNKIEIKTDSNLVKRSMTEWIQGWKKTHYMGKKNVDLWKIIDAYSQGLDIKWTHVNGHVGIYGNEMADLLASRAANS